MTSRPSRARAFRCTRCASQVTGVWATIHGVMRCQRCTLIACVGYVVEQLRLERERGPFFERNHSSEDVDNHVHIR